MLAGFYRSHRERRLLLGLAHDPGYQLGNPKQAM